VTLTKSAMGGGAVLSLLLATGAARADDDIAALRGRLDQIKELVADLEARLNALEAARSSAAQAPKPAATGAAVPVSPALSAPVPASAPAAATSAPASAKPPVAAAAPGEVPRVQWRRVNAGLTMDEVTGLIGAPTTTFVLAGKTVWYYYYPAIGAGSVFFDAHGRASSVQRPAGGSW